MRTHLHHSECGVARATLLLALLAILGLGGLGVFLILGRGPTPVQTKNILGEQELCQSCHPIKTHKPVAGHPELSKIGCLPCHGGEPGSLDEKAAHLPKLGEGRDPFLPKGQYVVACGRCHVIGQVKGMEKLARGHRSYLQGTCVGCHGPGHHPPEIGPNLRTIAGKNVAYLRGWLLNSRAVLATATMWSIRDATYHGYFADTAEGNANLDALISYVLMVNDSPQRRTYAAYAHRKKLRIDAPCTSCHLKGAKTSGAPHRCPSLQKSAELKCVRCHGTPDTAPKSKDGFCPQIAGGSHLCTTCHLRQDDGSKQLIDRALAGK